MSCLLKICLFMVQLYDPICHLRHLLLLNLSNNVQAITNTSINVLTTTLYFGSDQIHYVNFASQIN